MPDIWRIYRIENCRHTHPPKLKFVVIVCKDIDYMGFLVNSRINRFIQKKPDLLECQVILNKSGYRFLFHDSYLDCSEIYPFEDAELVVGLELVNDKTKLEIKTVVSKAKTIEKRYQNLISSS